MPDGVPRVLLVGHCGFDSGGLSRAMKRVAKDADVSRVNSDADLDQALASGDAVLLVNRALDGRFDARTGVELIAELAGRAPRPRMMLISNYPDAQAAAEQAGALPGVGKSDLKSEQAQARLRVLLGAE